MKSAWTRVLAVYPLAIPLVLGVLAAWFPGYIAYDDVTRRVNISFTVEEIMAGTAGGYAIIAGVFAKFGVKR